jgi:uncharacterized membrane protein HdeD (DUF308 family)
MRTEESGAAPPAEETPGAWQRALVTRAWQTSLLIGLITLVLGLILAFRPSGSLNVIAVLLGILVIVSGIFHFVRAFDRDERGRVWLGIAGALLIVIGVVLIRHIHLTTALIGLLIGSIWIFQGLIWLAAGLGGGPARGRGWWVLFGAITLIAGVVVAATPTSSITLLTALVGAWFAVLGVVEILGALMIRHAGTKAHRDLVHARHEHPADA